jgi:hypothetical protein
MKMMSLLFFGGCVAAAADFMAMKADFRAEVERQPSLKKQQLGFAAKKTTLVERFGGSENVRQLGKKLRREMAKFGKERRSLLGVTPAEGAENIFSGFTSWAEVNFAEYTCEETQSPGPQKINRRSAKFWGWGIGRGVNGD